MSEKQVTDINSPETTDIDVETLMGLIRRRVYSLPDARYIMGAIEKGRLYADGIVRLPPARPGWKSRAKSHITGFVLRALRANLRFQEVFNQSVVGVLQLIADDLHAYEKRFAAEGRAEPTSHAARQPSAQAAAGGFEGDETAPAVRFDRAGYEEKYLDQAPYSSRSLSIFRELLGESDVALELCCGRGELLATFAANGVTAVGVDPDALMVDLCRARGLHALRADVFDYLRGSPDSSFGGIFAGRVVERLTPEQTLELLGLAWRKLRRGGVFVACATNIDHPPALKNFYMDPGLCRPVPVRLLEFMLEQSRFRVHHFRFSAPDGAGRDADELVEPALSREVYPYRQYTVAAVRD